MGLQMCPLPAPEKIACRLPLLQRRIRRIDSFSWPDLSGVWVTVDAGEGGEDHEEGGREEEDNEDGSEIGLNLDGDAGDDEGVDQDVEEGDPQQQSHNNADRDEVF